MELVLPNNYVEIEEEEMMYLDGGGYWTHRGHADWTYTLTRNDFNKIATAIAFGASVSGAIAAFAPDPTIKALAGGIAALAGVYAAFSAMMGAWTNGFRVYFHTMWWGKQPRWASFL